MPSVLAKQLKHAVAFSGLYTVARRINVNHVSLAIALLSPRRSNARVTAGIVAAARRTNWSDLLPEAYAISTEALA